MCICINRFIQHYEIYWMNFNEWAKSWLLVNEDSLEFNDKNYRLYTSKKSFNFIIAMCM